MKLSSKALACGQSPMRKFHPYAVAAAAAGKKIYHLNIGQPDIHTPDALYDAIHNFRTPVLAYAASPGIPELIEAIRKYYENIGVGLDESDILITTGGSEALQIAANCLLDDGDEVIVPEPFYPNYHTFITTAGGVIHPLHTKPEEGYFYADRARIEACITPKTKAIIVNSPCNPTGAVMSEADVRAIAEVVKKYNLWVFSDEPYDAIVYDGVKAFSMAEIDEVRDHVVILNSFSKTYAMTGWRVGFLLMSDAAYIKEMAKLNEGLVSCVSSFSQVAAAEALSSNECVKSMVADYTRRRDILVDGINAVPGFTCAKPKGSFYAFVNIKAFGKSSQEFAEELIRGAHVICVPGTAFGAMGEGYLRLVFANSDENLEEAVRRIDEYVRKAYPDMK